MDEDTPIGRTKPSLEVLMKLAAYEEVEPTALEPPLYDVIDPEALDSLLTSSIRDRAQSTQHVVFNYRGKRIRVESDGTVDISDRDEDWV